MDGNVDESGREKVRAWGARRGREGVNDGRARFTGALPARFPASMKNSLSLSLSLSLSPLPYTPPTPSPGNNLRQHIFISDDFEGTVSKLTRIHTRAIKRSLAEGFEALIR